jgi:hypothetical protein
MSNKETELKLLKIRNLMSEIVNENMQTERKQDLLEDWLHFFYISAGDLDICIQKFDEHKNDK